VRLKVCVSLSHHVVACCVLTLSRIVRIADGFRHEYRMVNVALRLTICTESKEDMIEDVLLNIEVDHHVRIEWSSNGLSISMMR